MGEHVGQPHKGRLARDIVGVVALDHRGDRLGQAPATCQHSADQSMVDAELPTLAVYPLLRGARPLVHLQGVAGVGVHEHQLAYVVQ